MGSLYARLDECSRCLVKPVDLYTWSLMSMHLFIRCLWDRFRVLSLVPIKLKYMKPRRSSLFA